MSGPRRFVAQLLPWRSSVGLGLWLGLSFAALGIWREAQHERVPFLDDIDEALVSWKFRVRGQLRPGGDVVIGVIDERSLDRFGRWPWPREVFATLVKRLEEAGARVIAFDVIFDKPDVRPWRDPARALLDALEKAPGPRLDLAWLRTLSLEDPDGELARAVERHDGVILGFITYESEADAQGMSSDELEHHAQLVRRARFNLKVEKAVVASGVGIDWFFHGAKGVRAPVDVIARAAGSRLAYFNTNIDPRGTSVFIHLGMLLKGQLLPSLALAAAARYLDKGLVAKLKKPGQPPLFLFDDGARIPTGHQGRFYPNFYGPRNTFKHFSVADVIDGLVPRERLKDKLVFIGATALALYDLRPTPFDRHSPGVEIHATTADNILTGRYLDHPADLSGWEILALFLLGPLVGFAAGRQSRFWGAAFVLLFLVAAMLTDYLLFREGLLLRSSLLYIEIVIVALASYVLLYFLVYKERKRLRNTMQHYLAPSVLEEMLRDQSKLKLGGEKRELTVLFSDIRGFTTLSESFDAPDLVAFLNEYFSPMTDIVLRNRGTFDKYIGDALMAYFGAPQQQPDHAARACHACLDMRDKLDELNARWRARGLPTIGIGLGLSTGPSAFGNMGSSKLFNYTVIGDNVNVASRVEGASKLFGVVIAVAESTVAAAGDAFVFRRLGDTFVAGKGEAQSLYELVDRASRRAELQPWLDAYERGLAAWDARDLDAAEEGFLRALELHPSDLTSEKYLGRIEDARIVETWELAWKAAK